MDIASELRCLVCQNQTIADSNADLAAGTLARADHERARGELERRLLEDVDADRPGAKKAPSAQLDLKRLGIAAAVAIPLLAAVVYLATGNLGALDPARRAAQEVGMKEIEAMIQRLAERLEKNPDDVDGWKMLGKSYN